MQDRASGEVLEDTKGPGWGGRGLLSVFADCLS